MDRVTVSQPMGPSGPSVRYLKSACVVAAQQTTVPRYRARQDGYGSKIPTSWLIKLENETCWRRVYCVCWSNSGTAFILLAGQFTVVDTECQHHFYQLADQNREQG